MRQDWISFKRTHKHLIYGNHRPQLRNTDIGIKSRLKIVPFKASFLGKEDADLPDDLKKEAGYILWWMMQGHSVWTDDGKKIGTCEAIETETKDYYESQSTIDMWISDNCFTETVDGQPGSHWPKASELYKNYSEWKKDRGEYPHSQTRFGEQLSGRFTRMKADGVRYQGLHLNDKYGT